MPITAESIDNINRGILGDRFFGICGAVTGAVHLAIGRRGDRAAIPVERRSNIGGVTREMISGVGGHSTLADWVGFGGVQMGPGVATGNAYGFMVEITSTGLTLALRSGLNGQYPGPRPVGTRPDDEQRTLPQTLADNIVRELDMFGRTITINLGDI